MGRKIYILDTTLRDGEQAPGCSMDLREKLEIALQLEKLGVDIIEAGFAAASPGDMQAITEIAARVKNCAVTSLSRTIKGDIDATWQALKAAAAPRIHLVAATSEVHMRAKLKMKPERVLEMIGDSVKYAAALCSDVEFSAEDACRSDLEFLKKAFEIAIKNGATTVSMPDTVGYVQPGEMAAKVKYILENVEGIEKVRLSTHNHDDLGMAVSNTLEAVMAGASQIEVTINGIGERAGNASLEECVMALATRGDYFGAFTGINTKEIYRTCRMVRNITGIAIPPNKAVVGANAFAHEAGMHQHGVIADPSTYQIMTPADIGIPKTDMVLGKHSGRHAFRDRLASLGHNLCDDDLASAFKRFKALADRKKTVTDRDIEAILGDGRVEFPGRYSLDSFLINTGNAISSVARLTLFEDEMLKEGLAVGDGPIDAAFKAINGVLGCEFELDDYSLRSLTEGEDALGEASVRIKLDGRRATGRGLSTDVIEASIKAYINGVNKLLSEM